MAGRRRSISEPIRRAVLTEAGYRCAVPTCRMILALDLHHLVRVADNGKDLPDNLIALCPNCHALHHRGEISRESIVVWKGLLLSLSHAFDRSAVDILLMLSQGSPCPLRLSGDGLLKVAGLMASGLVELYVKPGPGVSYHRDSSGFIYPIQLSAKGRSFVEAWKRGDRQVAIAGE